MSGIGRRSFLKGLAALVGVAPLLSTDCEDPLPVPVTEEPPLPPGPEDMPWTGAAEEDFVFLNWGYTVEGQVNVGIYDMNGLLCSTGTAERRSPWLYAYRVEPKLLKDQAYVAVFHVEGSGVTHTFKFVTTQRGALVV